MNTSKFKHKHLKFLFIWEVILWTEDNSKNNFILYMPKCWAGDWKWVNNSTYLTLYWGGFSTPSIGIPGRRRKGSQVTLKSYKSAVCCIAASSFRLPTQHQGHIISLEHKTCNKLKTCLTWTHEVKIISLKSDTRSIRTQNASLLCAYWHI